MDATTGTLIIAAAGTLVAALRLGREDSKVAVDTISVALKAETERADREAARAARLECRIRQLEHTLRAGGLDVPPERRTAATTGGEDS